METILIATLSSFVGAVIGGLISYVLQKKKFEHEVKQKYEDNKTENMAIRTATLYLNVKNNYERSFEHLRNRIGGFEDDELRKLLVRAGAVRFFRDDIKNEWWCLYDRLNEKYNNEDSDDKKK